MSVICNKCGIQTRDSAKFCHGCGTPISTAALPPTMPIGVPSGDITPKPAVPLAPEPPPGGSFPKATEAMGRPQTSYIPQAPAPNYQQAMAKPKKSGSGVKIALGILLFLGVIIAGAIGGGIFLASKAIDRVTDTVKNTPGGVIPIGDNLKVKIGKEALNEADLQVPLYPNAKVTTPFNISAQTDSGRGGYATLETKDEYDVVVEWYLEKLGNDARRTKREDNEKKVTKYELSDDRGSRSVEITGYYRNRKNTEIKIFSAMESPDEKTAPSAPASPATPTGKKKTVVPVPPVPPASVDNLGEKIEKQVNESLDQADKQMQEQLEKKAIPARVRRQIQEQLREVRRKEHNATASPNQN